MPYDSKLDKQSFSKSIETDNSRVTVSVFSYNNGPKKLQVTRENRDTNDNFRFTRLGRISKAEIDSLLPIIQEAIKEM